jgi:hypothetical protein
MAEEKAEHAAEFGLQVIRLRIRALNDRAFFHAQEQVLRARQDRSKRNPYRETSDE